MVDTEFLGRNGFFWFYGVVEDRTDPEKLGRLRVRILGCHSKEKSFIKSEDLHWAYVVQPLFSAAMNGIGLSPTGPVPGTWVFGFFRDGESMQEPCVLGTLGGIPQNAAEPTIGFNDPRDQETEEKLASAPRKIKERKYPKDGSGAKLTPEETAKNYPRTEHPYGCVVGESDVNRIARNEKIEETIIQVIKDNVDKNVPISFEGTWNEAEPWYNGKYPFIHVYETESGHIVVFDDTPNAEGTLHWDRSGTFRETLKDGSRVEKIVKNGYTIVLSDNHVHVMNNQNERVDKECNLSVGGRWNIEVFGNINLRCHKNLHAHVKGNSHIKTDGNAFVKVNGDANVKVDGETKLQSGVVHVKTNGEIRVSSGGKISMISGGAFHITSSGDFAVDAPNIHLNSGVSSPSQSKSADNAIEPKQ